MSTLQHINSVVNYNWPEMSRRYPGFEKPQIVPAETLRGLAPIYLRSSIDQDPTSYFMFIAGDPTKGDCSRDVACQFFDELFYEKLRMPSSYEANEGYTREEAIDKEVLPPATDRQFRNFYDEQMAKVNAEQERQRRIDHLGFDPDDGNTIDVDVDGDSSSDVRAVGQAQSTAVGMPKKIFYCVDFHCPASGMLGYDGGRGGRLGGRRRPGGYLREADTGTPVSDILRAYNWARTNQRYSASLMSGLQAIAKCSPASDANARNASLHGDFNLYVFKYGDGRTTWIEEEVARPGNFNITFKDIADATHERWSRAYQTLEATVLTIDELQQMTTIAEDDDADPEKMMKEFVEKDADPEQMMKEFVEKKRKCGVKEDEYRRPKNQPHNLHQVDEGEDVDEDEDVEEDEYRRPKNQPHNLHQVDEKDDDGEVEGESEELNESMVRFCDRLIRG